MKESQLLFKIVRRTDGHEYNIFTDGRIEGFEKGCSIFNRYPMLLHLAAQSSDKNGIASSPSLLVGVSTEDRAGAEHGTPPNAEISGIAIATAPGEK